MGCENDWKISHLLRELGTMKANYEEIGQKLVQYHFNTYVEQLDNIKYTYPEEPALDVHNAPQPDPPLQTFQQMRNAIDQLQERRRLLCDIKEKIENSPRSRFIRDL